MPRATTSANSSWSLLATSVVVGVGGGVTGFVFFNLLRSIPSALISSEPASMGLLLAGVTAGVVIGLLQARGRRRTSHAQLPEMVGDSARSLRRPNPLSPTIVMVEGEGELRALLRENLEKKGIHVLEAQNWPHAIELLEHEKALVDAVLIDVRRSYEFDFAEILKRLHLELPLILVSTSGLRSVSARGGLELSREGLEEASTWDLVAAKIRGAIREEEKARVR